MASWNTDSSSVMDNTDTSFSFKTPLLPWELCHRLLKLKCIDKIKKEHIWSYFRMIFVISAWKHMQI